MNSLTNADPNSIGIIFQLISKYYYFGNDYANIDQFQQYQTAYYRCLKHVDMELNKIYDFLESNDYFSKAVICLTSDHGDYVGAHGLLQKGASIFNGGFNVPTFISYPNMDSNLKNTTSNIITSHVNLVPTLLELANIKNSHNPNLNFKPNNLSSSFIDCNGYPIEQDYSVVKLCLSINFGPLLLNLARTLKIPEIDLILHDKLTHETYFTVPAFSVSTIINLNNKIFNCGYYFSLYHVFYASLQNLLNKSINIYNLFYNFDDILILTDHNSPIGFVGTSKQIYFQLFTSEYVYKNFLNYQVDKFSNISNEYVYNLGNDDFYSTIIMSKTRLSGANIQDKLKENNSNYSNYSIYSNSDDITWSGCSNNLNLLIDGYDCLVNELVSNPTICPTKQIYYSNSISHPIFPKIKIHFNSNSNSNYKDKIIEFYSSFSNIIKMYIKIIIVSPV